MGSCLSSETDDGPGARPSKGENGADLQPVTIPDVVWKTDASWPESIGSKWKKAVETHTQDDFRAAFYPLLVKEAHDWLAAEYPECAKAGTIEDMQNLIYPPQLGSCPHPTRLFLAMDDDFTGTIYAAVAVVAPALREAEGNDPVWTRPGGSLDTKDLKNAKLAILEVVTRVRQTGANFNHAMVHVFIGADKFSCKFDTTTAEPTITDISSEPPDSFKATCRELAAGAREMPDQFRGKFRPSLFKTVVGRRTEEFPGATVWDEGEFPFSVNGVAYPYPTRLLVGRHFSKMSQDVDADIFSLGVPGEDDPAERPVKILRNANPSKDPGGVVSVTLMAAVDPNELWSDYGVYFETPAFKAAEAAVLEHVKGLYRKGKTQRCKAYVSMGCDQKWHKFVGDELAEVPESAAETASEKAHEYSSLETFGITLKEQAKHTLWQSENHFQAIKHQMLNRSQQDPEAYQNVAVQASLMAATHMLQLNFPGYEVSNEGEFPFIAADGGETRIADTWLLVVRDPKQAPADIVAAQHVVGRPRAGQTFAETAQMTWLGSEEMKAAEAGLLALLKKWHKEGRTSKVDCMALVAMGMDASIYQFVDGDKFVDYSDERMESFKWA